MTAPPTASPVLRATARSAPGVSGLPRVVRWSGLGLAAVVGAALGVGTGAVAALRRDRPMHAVGRTYHATVEPLPGARGSGVAWLDTLGHREGLVRFSRGAGLPPSLPDVQGIALRLPETRGHTDLLLSSTGLRGPARFLLVPRRSALAGASSSLMPFRGPGGPVLLAAEPVPDDRTTVPTVAERPAGPGASVAPTPTGTRWRLLWSGLGGPWHPFAELRVGADAGPVVDGGTRFDPLGATPPGLPPYRWAAALRAPAYRLSQLLGRPRAGTSGHGGHDLTAGTT